MTQLTLFNKEDTPHIATIVCNRIRARLDKVKHEKYQPVKMIYIKDILTKIKSNEK